MRKKAKYNILHFKSFKNNKKNVKNRRKPTFKRD